MTADAPSVQWRCTRSPAGSGLGVYERICYQQLELAQPSVHKTGGTSGRTRLNPVFRKLRGDQIGRYQMKHKYALLLILLPLWLYSRLYSAYSTVYAQVGGAADGQIAFVSDRDGNQEIYLINADGSGLTNLTRHPAGDRGPAWSPDGSQLAFISNRDGTQQVYLMNADGSEVRQITDIVPKGDSGFFIGELVWSPSGIRIAFSTNYRMTSLDIYWIDRDGNNLTKIYSDDSYGGRITWSPDEQHLLFDSCAPGNFDLFMVGLDGSNLRTIADGIYSGPAPATSKGNPSWEITPAWSPDGRQIAFVSDRLGGHVDIWVANPDGSGAQNVTGPVGGVFGPVWSPDSQWIALMAGGYGFYIVHPDGSDLTELSGFRFTGSSAEWSWSPDSSRIAFATGSGDGYEVYIVSADGSGVVNLTIDPAHDTSPAWRPASSTTTISLDISLTQPVDFGNEQPFPPNRLTIGTTVTNLSSEETSPPVTVTFYRDNPDQGGEVIDSAVIPSLSAGESQPVSVAWILDGNVENLRVYARATTENVVDPNLDNNTASRQVRVYYVNFRLDEDAYSFSNHEVGTVTVGDIDDFFNDIDYPIVLRPIVSPVFLLLFEMNGWCYGMANSSAVYHTHPELKPIPTELLYNHGLSDARPTIRTYQSHVLGGVIRALMGLEPSDPNEQYSETLEKIKQGRLVIHGLMERRGLGLPTGSHAVVAYKIVDVGTERRVYYYDGNLPLKYFANPDLLPQRLALPDSSESYGVFSDLGFSEPIYGQKGIYYNKAYPLEPVASAPDNLRLLLIQLAEWLARFHFSEDFLSVSVSGAVDIVAVDLEGRRTGYVDGMELDVIPGAQRMEIEGKQTLFLPASADYQLWITPNGDVDSRAMSPEFETGDDSNVIRVAHTSAQIPAATRFSLDIVVPHSESAVRMVSYQDTMISDGGSAVVEFSRDVVNPQMSLPDETRASPTSDVVVDVDEVERQISESAATLPSDADQAESIKPEDQAIELPTRGSRLEESPDLQPEDAVEVEQGVDAEQASHDIQLELIIPGIVIGVMLTVAAIVLVIRSTKRGSA